jgi:hypothetical protein
MLFLFQIAVVSAKLIGPLLDTKDKKSQKMEIRVKDFISGIPKEANETVKSLVTYVSFGDDGQQ